MRDLRELNKYRDFAAERNYAGVTGLPDGGIFHVPSPIDRGDLLIIASNGGGWDHVSVSRRNRAPNWAEMSHVAGLCFLADEVAMQLHVPVEDHVNNHPYCLHWWRPNDGREIPRPPAILVGVKELGDLS